MEIDTLINMKVKIWLSEEFILEGVLKTINYKFDYLVLEEPQTRKLSFVFLDSIMLIQTDQMNDV